MYWNHEFQYFSGIYNLINRNMRCIEIGLKAASWVKIIRLIETWDVLKLIWILESIENSSD